MRWLLREYHDDDLEAVVRLRDTTSQSQGQSQESNRADQMPYSGVKECGIGREGVRSAMDDLTVDRVLVLTGVTP
jgi:hypothetical protein